MVGAGEAVRSTPTSATSASAVPGPIPVMPSSSAISSSKGAHALRDLRAHPLEELIQAVDVDQLLGNHEALVGATAPDTRLLEVGNLSALASPAARQALAYAVRYWAPALIKGVLHG